MKWAQGNDTLPLSHVFRSPSYSGKIKMSPVGRWGHIYMAWPRQCALSGRCWFVSVVFLLTDEICCWCETWIATSAVCFLIGTNGFDGDNGTVLIWMSWSSPLAFSQWTVVICFFCVSFDGWNLFSVVCSPRIFQKDCKNRDNCGGPKINFRGIEVIFSK